MNNKPPKESSQDNSSLLGKLISDYVKEQNYTTKNTFLKSKILSQRFPTLISKNNIEKLIKDKDNHHLGKENNNISFNDIFSNYYNEYNQFKKLINENIEEIYEPNKKHKIKVNSICKNQIKSQINFLNNKRKVPKGIMDLFENCNKNIKNHQENNILKNSNFEPISTSSSLIINEKNSLNAFCYLPENVNALNNDKNLPQKTVKEEGGIIGLDSNNSDIKSKDNIFQDDSHENDFSIEIEDPYLLNEN